MENVIDLAKRRAASVTRAYIIDIGPSAIVPLCPAGTFTPVTEPIKEDAPPSPVATAAKLLARAILWARELTPRQKLEARLLRQTMLARSEGFQKLWQDKADLVALSITSPLNLRPAFAVSERRYRPVSLWPWLLAGVSFAMALAVTPAAWLGL